MPVCRALCPTNRRHKFRSQFQIPQPTETICIEMSCRCEATFTSRLILRGQLVRYLLREQVGEEYKTCGIEEHRRVGEIWEVVGPGVWVSLRRSTRPRALLRECASLLHADFRWIPPDLWVCLTYLLHFRRPRRNIEGRTTRPGITGKFYCGSSLGVSCSCCNGSCGPTGTHVSQKSFVLQPLCDRDTSSWRMNYLSCTLGFMLWGQRAT